MPKAKILLFTIIAIVLLSAFNLLSPLTISVIALIVSLISVFKNELFDFKLRVIPCELTLLAQKKPEVIYSIFFMNEGYGQGVIEWVGLKVYGPMGEKSYIPVGEVNIESFLQRLQPLHHKNVHGPFVAFILGSKEVAKYSIWLIPEGKELKQWVAGEYHFELWGKILGERLAKRLHTKKIMINDGDFKEDMIVTNLTQKDVE